MNKTEFFAKETQLHDKIAELRKAADTVINADVFDQAAFDERMAEVAKYDAQIKALKTLGYEQDAEERSFEDSPAVHRSKGRQTANTIHEHAAKENFSVTRCVEAVRQNRSLTGVENEVNQELRKQSMGNGAGDFMVPADFSRLNKRANFDTSNGAAGVVPTLWDAGGFIDYLYPMLAGPKLGVQYRSGVMAGTKVPRLTAPPTVAAAAESGDATASTPTTDDVFYQAHALNAKVTSSYRAGYSSVVDSDRLIYESAARQIAAQMESGFWNGTGSSNQVTGLLNVAGTNSVPVTGTSNTLAYADILKAKKLVQKANANFGSLAWATSPSGFEVGQKTPKLGTTYPTFCVSDSGTIIAEPVVVTTLIPDNLTYSGTSNTTVFVYGNWQFCHIATFGQGLYVTVDGISGNPGDVTAKFLIDYDVQFDHPGAFSICLGATY